MDKQTIIKEIHEQVKGKKPNFEKILRLCCENNITKEALSSEGLSLDSLCYNYFIQIEKTNSELELWLLTLYSDSFIKGVQTSKIFLSAPDEIFNALCEYANKGNEEFRKHLSIWKDLRAEERKLWDNVLSSFRILKEQSYLPKEVLVLLVYNLYERLWRGNADYYNLYINNLSIIYELFIQYYFSEIHHITDKEIFSETPSTKEKEYDNLKSIIDQILNSLEKWQKFMDPTITTYCYDENVILKKGENNKVIVFLKESDYAEWKNDQERYDFIDFVYNKDSEGFLNEAKKVGPYQEIGETEDEKAFNHECDKKRDMSQQLLEHACLWTYLEQQKLDIILPALIYWSARRKAMFEDKLFELKEKYKKSWLETLQLGCEEGHIRKNEDLPYEVHTYSSCHELISYGLNKQLPKDLTNNFLNLISYKAPKNFNRFKHNYNCFINPLFKISEYEGGEFFSPMLFFANNDWFYTLYQLCYNKANIDKQYRKESSNEMEKKLLDKLRNKTDNRYIYHQIEENESRSFEKGDADIIVYDKEEKIYLLIQLKRTSIRTDLSTQYNEKIQTDKKGYLQLNIFKKKLMSSPINDDLPPLTKEAKCHTWLVSTSFENNHKKREDGIIKINYFELIYILTREGKKSLQELIEYVEKDCCFNKWKEVLITYRKI